MDCDCQGRQAGGAAVERWRPWRTATPPGTSNVRGWGADHDHPREFFPGRGWVYNLTPRPPEPVTPPAVLPARMARRSPVSQCAGIRSRPARRDTESYSVQPKPWCQSGCSVRDSKEMYRENRNNRRQIIGLTRWSGRVNPSVQKTILKNGQHQPLSHHHN
jgi:hypothetical protein